jgi:hypothetical protein
VRARVCARVSVLCVSLARWLTCCFALCVVQFPSVRGTLNIANPAGDLLLKDLSYTFEIVSAPMYSGYGKWALLRYLERQILPSKYVTLSAEAPCCCSVVYTYLPFSCV